MLKVFAKPGLASGSALGAILRQATFFADKMRRHAEAARARRVLAALSPEQLEDTGIDPDSIGPTKPRIEVSRQLMARLMTLR